MGKSFEWAERQGCFLFVIVVVVGGGGGGVGGVSCVGGVGGDGGVGGVGGGCYDGSEVLAEAADSSR